MRTVRRWLSLALTAILLATTLPAGAQAVDANTRKCVQYDACWYSTDSQCLTGGPAGSGPLFGLHFPKVSDTADLANRIDAYIKSQRPDSPINGFGKQLVGNGQTYNINPAFVVGAAQQETSLGTDQSRSLNNFFGIGPTAGYPSSGGRAVFPSVAAGLEAYYKQITSARYKDTQTIGDVINITTPSSDPRNDVPAYIAAVNDIMQKILGGSPVDTGSTAVAPVSSCGNGSTSAGALGWDLGNGTHAMVSYDQGDPRWGNQPYGAGKTSLANSGCGPTSVAMVVATLTGNSAITPLTTANRYGGTYHVAEGSSWGLFPAAGADYNLHESDLGTNLNAAAGIIRQGGLVVISVSAGYFTGGGHLMVIRAVTPDGTGFYLADPNGDGRHNDSETRAFSAAFLAGEGNMQNLFGFTK